MNREKENLSIKYNTSKDSKLSHQTYSNTNSKLQPVVAKQTEEGLKEKKAANLRKSSNIVINSKQSKFQDNQTKRKSVSPVAENRFKKVLTNNFNNLITKQIETKAKIENVQTEKASDNNLSKIPYEINADTKNIDVKTEVTELRNPVNSDNSSNSNNNSKNKRKYSIFAKDSETELKTFSELQSKLDDSYKDYEIEKSGKNWIQKFKENVLHNEILIEHDLFIPRTLSSSASKILNLEKFWILWIEFITHTKEDISIQDIIDVFNESFKHINEEKLIKSYYLKCIKQIDHLKMKEFLKSKGKNIEENSSSITNDVYLDLLDLFAQFMLRSNSTKKIRQKHSEESRKIIKSNIENISACQDVELMIASNNKREFLNTQISQNENFVYSKSKIAYYIETNNFQFKTPIQKQISIITKNHSESKMAKSIKEVDETRSPLSPLCDSILSRQNSELKDFVHEPLYLFTQKTENMIVSQNTVNKQIEFLNNLSNANCNSINVSQSNFEHDTSNHINYSMYPNLTQESEYIEHVTNPFCENHESISDSFNKEEENDIQQLKEDNVSEFTETPELKEEKIPVKDEIPKERISDSDFYSNKKPVYEDVDCLIKDHDNNIEEKNKENVLKSPFKSFKIKSDPDDAVVFSHTKEKDGNETNLEISCPKFLDSEAPQDIIVLNHEEVSQKKNEEEDLDSICELQAQNESEQKDKNDFNDLSSYINFHTNTREHPNLNMSVHSNHSQSRSRSHRRSKYQSMIIEEFPSDLVEGSIRTFNQSFSGLESIHKSERFPSSTKFKEDN